MDRGDLLLLILAVAAVLAAGIAVLAFFAEPASLSSG